MVKTFLVFFYAPQCELSLR